MADRFAVLVLGASGMLGSTVVRRLRATRPEWRVDAAARGVTAQLKIDAEAGRPGLADLFKLARYDFVVNCIGVLKPAIDERSPESLERAVRVNALFPHEVADVAAQNGSSVVHVSTDAIFSGRKQEPYLETDAPDPTDLYGATKLLGESPARNVLNVRCSIVGRDRRQRGLVEWYLTARTPSVRGFVDYVWTPITTVQLADWCAALLDGGFDAARAGGHILHLAPNPAVSKADFLQAVRHAVGSGPSIERISNPSGPCARILASSRGPSGPSQAVASPAWPAAIPEMLTEFQSRGA